MQKDNDDEPKVKKEYSLHDLLDVVSEDESGTKHTTKPETQLLDFTNPDFSFIAGQNHTWLQRGPWVICSSCPLEHAVGAHGKIMTGVKEDGTPNIVTSQEYFNQIVNP